jgi:hypothetical protein
MASDAITERVPERQEPGATLPAPPTAWPAVALVGLYWAFQLTARAAELPMFTRFLTDLAACGFLLLLFTLWWLVNRRLGLGDRLLGVGAAASAGLLAALLSPPGAGGLPFLLAALPWVFTAWAAWLVLARRTSARTRRRGLLVTLFAAWGFFALIRMDGLTGEGKLVLHWRWTPTAEDLYLAERAREGGGATAPRQPDSPQAGETPQDGDWPAFRGPDRDGTVRGTRIRTDWNAPPPRPVWRRRVGPAWSSAAVVGGRLFTQEQRGPSEAVVCLDTRTGREIWAHQDAARFWDGQAGPGPRATPAFGDGRVFALGATGILNCLDARTGERKWSHDVAAEAGVKAPIWGFSTSPLVASGVVVVFAGGEPEKGLLAYRAGSGEPAWAAAAGKTSYASPQPASLGGKDQVLFPSDRGLIALAPATGSLLWEYDLPARGLPWSLQPHPVGGGQVLVASADLGAALIDVTPDGRTFAPTQRWVSRQLKPSFNDFVVHKGFVYGFDGEVFCCVDLESGRRRWKEGPYGHGQVLLLADQDLLLVVSENGEAVLLAANPDRRQELGRFQAVQGKTWNHPVIARDRLYVRNAEEFACYDLAGDRR